MAFLLLPNLSRAVGFSTLDGVTALLLLTDLSRSVDLSTVEVAATFAFFTEDTLESTSKGRLRGAVDSSNNGVDVLQEISDDKLEVVCSEVH